MTELELNFLMDLGVDNSANERHNVILSYIKLNVTQTKASTLI